ncbi:MAG: 30S ribosome-binding factor RbfA [bacterium]
MSTLRTKKISEVLHKAVSHILEYKVKDPRIGFATVMDVEVSPDLMNVQVNVSIMGTDKQKRDALIGLQQASGFIRKEAAKRVSLKKMPDFKFLIDKSLDYQDHINDLLDNLEYHVEDK